MWSRATRGFRGPSRRTDHNNFAPRVGFAWKAPKSIVVRGGVGLFFAQDEGFGVSQRMTNNPPFVGFGGYAIVSDQLNISSTIPLSAKLACASRAARPARPTISTLRPRRRSAAGRCATPSPTWSSGT